MLALERNDYERQEVMDALHANHGSRRLSFRFDLLDANDSRIGDITHLVEADSSSVSMDSEAEIHRTAKFRIRDVGEIDFLKDRIQPFARLKMPRMTERVDKTYQNVETTETDFLDGQMENVSAVDGDLTLQGQSSVFFDGEDDYVDIPDSSSSLSMEGVDHFTFSCWKYFDPSLFDKMDYRDNIFSKAHRWYGSQSGDFVFGGGLHSERSRGYLTYITLGLGGNEDAWLSSSSFVLPYDRLPGWLRYTVTYALDAGEYRKIFYVHGEDGSLIHSSSDTRTSSDWSGIVATGWNANIFRSPRTRDCSIGNLRDLSVWERSLNQSEIENMLFAKLNGDEEGLKAYWKMDEGEGNRIGDSTGNGFDGEVHGGTWETKYAEYGSRQSPPIMIPTHYISDHSIAWTALEPSGANLTVETSIDGITWENAENGGVIPGLTSDVIPERLYVRQKLRTRERDRTPALKDLSVTIDGWTKKVTQSQYIEFPLGVFLLSTPQKEYQGDNIYRSIDAYDKLQILVDDGFTARVKAEEGELVTDFIESIISAAGITKINIERAEKTFPTWMSWEPDTSRLEVINELLEVINYEKLHVDEYGYFTSRPYRTPEQRSAEYAYATDDLSVISPGAKAEQDFFSIPNEFVGVVSEPDRVPLTHTYKNENTDSPTSIPNRGRTITTYIDADSVDLETLKGTVKKAAYEQSQVYTQMSFDTAIMPMHSYNDVLQINHDKLDISGKYEEVSWDMPLSAAGTMSHTVKAVVSVGGDIE